jgi:cell division protease FtsH
MGSERKSMIISEEEKKVIAFHEAGHALVAKLLEHTDPLHKVSIIPRGLALGVTQQLPTQDRHILTRKQAKAEIHVLLGGRVAEELVLDEQTSGASNDIERATDLARKMVCEWGMGSLGPLAFGKKEEQIFLGREIAQHRDYSEETARAIDQEVRTLVEGAHVEVRKMMEENVERLHRLAQGLLDYETLDADDVDRLVKGEPMSRPKPVSTRLVSPPGGGQGAETKVGADKPLPGKPPAPEPGVA